MNTVSQLLANKKHWAEGDHGTSRIERVHTITKSSSVLDAARMMNAHRVGSLIVLDSMNDVAGIITERDILARVVFEERSPRTTLVSEVMTPEIITCDSCTTLSEIRRVMKDQCIRHIPVIDDGTLVGMVSIGDLNAACNASLNIEVKAMLAYITGG